ncbi:MAG: PqqD family protein [Terriglobales bacterium]
MNAKYIARSSAIASRLLGGEMMIMSTLDSTFFTLNPVATVIWQAADGRTPVAEIVAQQVCTEFEVDFETAQHDVECFVEELSGHGILLISDRPFAEAASSPTEAA